MMPAIIFFASLGIFYFQQYKTQNLRWPKPGMRFAAGCAVAIIFLYLAFFPELV
jgi:hypothetical protein